MTLRPQTVLERLLQAGEKGLTLADLATALELGRGQRSALGGVLDHLCNRGVVQRAAGKRFVALPAGGRRGRRGGEAGGAGPAAAEAIVPAVSGHIRVHPAGYGFVEREDGGDDVFVPARYRGAALDGDRVALDTWLGAKGTEGRVVSVLARGRAKLTGIIRRDGRSWHLDPDDPRIPGAVALDEGAASAREGQAVLVEIVRYPSHPDEQLGARVLQVLGDPDDPRTEVRKIVVCADIPEEFSADAGAAAARVAPEVQPADLVDRVDLRDRDFVTIDPETARDFDDAVCVEQRGDEWRLWVAIADVSAYVRAGTALDREARSRGVSVYLPDRAIAMLPEALSSGICSLMPEVDRLAMVVRLDLDATGAVVGTLLEAAVIRSRARLDYAGVAAALAGDFRGARARYRDYAEHLARVAAVARLLRTRREARGTLDLDLPEAKVILDEDDPRRVRDVRHSKPSADIKFAYAMIEDCMVTANEAVAGFFRARGLDTVWRVHAPPTLERLEEFARVAAGFGLHLRPADGLKPLAIRRLLLEMRGRPMERPLTFLLLRSLKQAVYDTTNVGHFGLASVEYLHFTSPIRRYADLIVHRLLKHALRREGIPAGGGGAPPPDRAGLTAMATESSHHEQRAVQAEREVVDMYRAYLMRDRVGDEFDGVVAAVTSFGLFVEIADPFVEGLVRLEALGQGPWEFDPERLRLGSPRSGRSFALGDKLRVVIASVSVPRRRIDLALADAERGALAAPEPRAADAPAPGREARRGRRPAPRRGRRG
jgi:ribonuclease R